MNEAITSHRSDNVLDLGKEIQIDLDAWASNEEEFTVEQLIAALEATTTLTTLDVVFLDYNLITSPRIRTIAALWHHFVAVFPICAATTNIIRSTNWIFGMPILTKKLECWMFLIRSWSLRNNAGSVICNFSRARAVSLPPVDRLQDSSASLTLDRLILRKVAFENSAAVTNFVNFVSHVNVTSLSLNEVTVTARDGGGGTDDDDDENIEFTERMVAELMKPSVEQLNLEGDCQIEHFQAALKAGMATLTELFAWIEFDGYSTTKLSLDFLACFIRGAVKLKSITIVSFNMLQARFIPQHQLIQAIESCATLTQVRVNLYGRRDFSLDEVQLLQQTVSRNRELDRFVASAGTYPTDKLLTLMLQFDNCPTGRYMLARCLPEILSFHIIKSTDSPRGPIQKKKKIA